MRMCMFYLKMSVRTIGIISILAGIHLVGCSKYPEGEINDLKNRVEILEHFCDSVNNDIKALQALFTVQQNGDCITAVTPLPDGDGVTITFLYHPAVIIRNGAVGSDGKDGKDGKDGTCPVIGVKQGENGTWYWTQQIGDQTPVWIIGPDGERIRVTGLSAYEQAIENGYIGTLEEWLASFAGTPGADAKAPIIGINTDGYWTINDGTGVRVIKDENGNPVSASGTSGNLVFHNIKDSTDCVIFTLADKVTRLYVHKYIPFTFDFDNSPLLLNLSEIRELECTCEHVATIKIMQLQGWQVTFDSESSRLTVKAPAIYTQTYQTEGEIMLFALNDKGQYLIRTLEVTLIPPFIDIRKLDFTTSDVLDVFDEEKHKVAEVCLEFIPGYSDDPNINKRAIVLYPYDENTRTYGMGYIPETGASVTHNGLGYNVPPPATRAWVDQITLPNQNVTIAPALLKDFEGRAYRLVKIGKDYWMAENLATERRNDNSVIYNGQDNLKDCNTMSAVCCYTNAEITPAESKQIYGVMYNGFLIEEGLLAPHGWHVSTQQDFKDMIAFLGGKELAWIRTKPAIKTKPDVTKGDWLKPYQSVPEGNNLSGFTALPGTNRNNSYISEFPIDLGKNSYWWTEKIETVVITIDNINTEIKFSPLYIGINNSHYVRCVKD